MKVKIGDVVYDSKVQPIIIILEDYNKEDISNMEDGDYVYCEFPDSFDEQEIKELMENVD